MGNDREMRMWDWLETHRDEAERRWVAYVRRVVNDPAFGSHEPLIAEFWEWCMENFDKDADQAGGGK